ncbi:MAG: VanW family protein [Patescibacteria group bacterium]|nr:VanW family protein [Patescibacteria group bacterium]
MKLRTRILKYFILGLIGILILFFLFFGGYSVIFAKKIYLNQKIGEVSLGGKTKQEAEDLLKQRTKEFTEKNIVLKYKDADGKEKTFEIKPSDINLQYDNDSTIKQIWQYGREGNIFISFWRQLHSIFAKNYYKIAFSLNEESLNKKIAEISSQTDQPEKDYSLIYNDSKFNLTQDRKEGSRIDQDEIKSNLNEKIAKIKNNEIYFSAKTYKPQIAENKANSRLEEANKILAGGDLVLQYEDQQFKMDSDSMGGLIKSRPNGDDMEIFMNDERLGIFAASLAKSIDISAQNAQLAIKDGKATVFQTARLGKTLDQIQTKVDIQNALFARVPSRGVSADPAKITLKVALLKPEITDDSITSMGIAEIVGSGTTDFKNSPANRTHNIQVGAAAINGTLVKPGETFSTLNKLGAIDASSGYLEELVIKENRTMPEFGGGLCQVSSTLFRAAMNAGLNITERQNHKYRVSYYEPPVGMDATIYDPAPDFKFTNNYSSYILIQSKVVGTKITFDIYGTKDGRQVSLSDPEVYDITDPDPPLMIETDTLAPGEQKLVERAHQGASAKFNYRVTKGEEVLQQKTFTSKYVPWQEKWLVGKGAPPASSEPAPAEPVPAAPETSSSTTSETPASAPEAEAAPTATIVENQTPSPTN